MEFDIVTVVILFFAGVFAGFVDSIAGGGGIIILPTLLAVGIPPHHALATNSYKVRLAPLQLRLTMQSEV